MNNLTKTIVYVVLVIAAIGFGGKFYSSYKQMKTRDVTGIAAATEEKDNPTAPNTSPTNQSTNVAAADTNAAPTNATAAATNAADTNVAVQATNAIPDTNVVAQSTSQMADTNTPTNTASAPAAATNNPKSSGGSGSMMAYMGAFLATIIILGFMVAKDVSGMFGQTAIDFLFNDDLKGVHDPEYEEALQAVHRGKPLDAIQLLREYLQKNPRAQYAALEIAEIYEKHLNNHLAAALEYEEILKKKLPDERWGWAAIHLCNLYGKMGKTEKTAELLRRIVNEYGETAAAKKARKRLALYESGGDADSLGLDVPETTADVAAEAVATPKAKAKEEAPAEPTSNLPPGFRPKK